MTRGLLTQENLTSKPVQTTDCDIHECVFVALVGKLCYLFDSFGRPLPLEMVRYAREDTHYLLYICDRLHNELIKSGNANSNLLQSVYTRSKDVCLKVCGLTWFLIMRVRGMVATWSVHPSPDRAVWIQALAGDIVSCSWASGFTLTVPLSLHPGV